MKNGTPLARRGLGLMTLMALVFNSLLPVNAQNSAPDDSPGAASGGAVEEATNPPAGVSGDWWGEVQENLRKAEYNISWQEQTYLSDLPMAYQAPNRTNNLRAYFAPGGLILIPRQWDGGMPEPPWRWEVRLAAASWEASRPADVSAELFVQENLIEYRRQGLSTVEWYRNDENGVEQGFRIQENDGAVQPASLDIRLAFAGDLLPCLSAGGGVVDFLAPDETPVLRYRILSVEDAGGQSLGSQLVLDGAAAVLRIDSQAAIYPIQVRLVINGLSTGWNWKMEGNAAEIEFGYDVATAGDVNGDLYSDVIVGAPKYDGGLTDQGRAFVYHGSPSGLSATPSWQVGVNLAGAQFGAAVSTAGDVNGDGYADVIVGAPFWESIAGQADEGGFWVYHGRYQLGLDPNPAGHAEIDQAGAQLGTAVAFAGNVNGDAYSDVIVGAPFANSGHGDEGVVRVYHGSSAGIGNPALFNWQAQSDQTSAHFGNSVSTAGDVNGDSYADVIIGAPEYDNGEIDEGKVFAWYGSASGVNGNVAGIPGNAAWSIELNQASALLGVDVSTAGDVNGDGYSDVIVGAPYWESTGTQADEGGDWVYYGSSGGLSASWALHDEGNQAGAHFGTAVNTAGDVNGDGYADIIVGAPYYTNGESDEGRVWVWHGSANGLSALNDWTKEGNNTDAKFGVAVATAGDVNGDGYSDVIIGAKGYHNSLTNEGAAFAYYGSPETLSDTAYWDRRSNQAGAAYGWTVSTAGDVNGDGYADVLVGAPFWDAGENNEGAAWVYQGSVDGMSPGGPDWYKTINVENAEFGFSIASAGDVNGDGYSDVIVGAPYFSNPSDSEGRAFVYHGTSTGLSDTHSWVKESNQAGAHFGFSVSTAGDVNGDGYSDVIVGAPHYNNSENDEGLAFVYQGTASGLHTVPDWYGESNHADAWYGYSVSTAGDVNGDGYSEVIVGSPYWHDDAVNEGRAWLYYGTGGGLQKTDGWHAESNLLGAGLGWSVSTAGDVNGDGFSDVIVGAPYWGDGGLSSEGKVWVFHGAAGGLNASAAWARESGQSGAYYGYSVSTAGDVNGDGYADIILGVPLYNDVLTSEGGTRLYCGSASGLESSYAWKGRGGQGGAWYGISVSTAGDVNGDGYADVVVGAKGYNEVHTDEGKVYVYYGNASRGVSITPRQARYGSGRSIAQLGLSDSAVGFRVYSNLRSPFGRVALQPQMEYKPLGVPYNGASFWWGYYDNIMPGSTRYTTYSDLTPATPYHWRFRIRYQTASNPFLPASRWLTMPWNGQNEMDFRTAGSRIFLPLTMR